MSLDPSHDLEILMAPLWSALQQCMAADPATIKIDVGQAQQVRDGLNNLINATLQMQQSGKTAGAAPPETAPAVPEPTPTPTPTV